MRELDSKRELGVHSLTRINKMAPAATVLVAIKLGAIQIDWNKINKFKHKKIKKKIKAMKKENCTLFLWKNKNSVRDWIRLDKVVLKKISAETLESYETCEKFEESLKKWTSLLTKVANTVRFLLDKFSSAKYFPLVNLIKIKA